MGSETLAKETPSTRNASAHALRACVGTIEERGGHAEQERYRDLYDHEPISNASDGPRFDSASCSEQGSDVLASEQGRKCRRERCGQQAIPERDHEARRSNRDLIDSGTLKPSDPRDEFQDACGHASWRVAEHTDQHRFDHE